MKVWETMKSTFDDSLRHHWETLAEGGVVGADFYDTEPALCLFAAEKDLDIAFEKVPASELERAEAIARISQTSDVGRSLFASDLVKVRRTLFIREIEEKVQELVGADFNDQDVVEPFDLSTRLQNASGRVSSHLIRAGRFALVCFLCFCDGWCGVQTAERGPC